jgi:hypothetical protein
MRLTARHIVPPFPRIATSECEMSLLVSRDQRVAAPFAREVPASPNAIGHKRNFPAWPAMASLSGLGLGARAQSRSVLFCLKL